MVLLVILVLITVKLKGFTFVDIQLIVMIVAVSLILDMVFCKWLNYYAYVVTYELKSFYSLIFCILGYPSLGIIFINSFRPPENGLSLTSLRTVSF